MTLPPPPSPPPSPGPSVYYHYTMSNNGRAEVHGGNYSLDYLTDRLKEHAVAFIHQSAPKARAGDAPFFMYVATPAPHRPATPAPQYAHQFDGKAAPRTPSYGFAGTNKHWIISKGAPTAHLLRGVQCYHVATRNEAQVSVYMSVLVLVSPGTPPLDASTVTLIDELYQRRLESLLSVDDLVSEVLDALEVGLQQRSHCSGAPAALTHTRELLQLEAPGTGS